MFKQIEGIVLFNISLVYFRKMICLYVCMFTLHNCRLIIVYFYFLTFHRGGFTGYFLAECRYLPWVSPTTRQSASKKQNCLVCEFSYLKGLYTFTTTYSSSQMTVLRKENTSFAESYLQLVFLHFSVERQIFDKIDWNSVD